MTPNRCNAGSVRRAVAALAMAALALPALSLPGGAMAETLDDYKWENRLLLVFAPEIVDDQYDRQMQELLRHRVDTRERDLKTVEVIGVEPVRVDALTEEDMSPVELRERFEVPENEFAALLLGKDGTVKMRSDAPIPAQALFDKIDSMPMRQREMQAD